MPSLNNNALISLVKTFYFEGDKTRYRIEENLVKVIPRD